MFYRFSSKRRVCLRHVIIFFTALLVSGATTAQPDQYAELHKGAYEDQLLEIIDVLQQGKLELALEKANRHVETYPKSSVGHLLKADILTAMSSTLDQVGAQAPMRSELLRGLTHQIKNRWQHHASGHDSLATSRYPSSLIEIGKHQHVIVADMNVGRLYLYQNANGEPKLLRDYYLTVGSAGYGKQVEGDNKTPIGVYSIYRYIDSDELPDLYGEGAFPVDYPNVFDRYKKRTGYGIWLHGTPSDTYARSPWASEGCFVLSNADLADIKKFIDVSQRTPVILSDGINWITKQQLLEAREQFLALLNQWKADWESLDNTAYFSHYSSEKFNLGKANYKRWAERKKAVNDSKTFVQIDLDIDSLFLYPGEQDMFVVKYTQRYLSNNYQGESKKQQYWQRDSSGKWKIIYEG